MSGEALTLGPEDGGREVAVRRGGALVLRLPENPTTGFRWQPEVSAGLRLVRDSNELGAAPGAGGMRVFEYEATVPGKGELSLRSRRSWESPSDADPAFRVTVRVD